MDRPPAPSTAVRMMSGYSRGVIEKNSPVPPAANRAAGPGSTARAMEARYGWGSKSPEGVK